MDDGVSRSLEYSNEICKQFSGIDIAASQGGGPNYDMDLLHQRISRINSLYIQLTTFEMESIAHTPKDLIVLCKIAGGPSRLCRNFVQEGGTLIFSPFRGVCYSINLRAFPPNNISAYEYDTHFPLLIQVSVHCSQ